MTKSLLYEVCHDQNRHTCIVVERTGGGIRFIRMAMVDIEVERRAEREFYREFTRIEDYPVERAARRYLESFNELKLQISLEARAHLERIAGPAFKRENLVDEDPAPKPLSTLKKEEEMSKTEKATPAKKPIPPKKTTAEAPVKKAAPAKKPAAAEEPGKRGRQPGIAGTAKIKILTAENPKRAVAAERFALYKNGMTVDAYIEAGGTRADVNWDVKQGFIEVK